MSDREMGSYYAYQYTSLVINQMKITLQTTAVTEHNSYLKQHVDTTFSRTTKNFLKYCVTFL